MRSQSRRASRPASGPRPHARSSCSSPGARLKDRLPIARLLNRVLADTGYDAALQFEFLGDRKLANLWKLIDLARSFDRTGLFGLHEFTARLGDLVSRQPREEQAATLPEKADVVRLMSIHQAKGLEFPVVFVPDIAAQRSGDRSPVARWHRTFGCLVKVPGEFDYQPEKEPRPFAPFANELGRTADQLADWQEDLRILYVACTRAIDRLILSGGVPDSDGPLPANHWTVTLEERFNVRTGKCIAADVKAADLPHVQITASSPISPKPPEVKPPNRPHTSLERMPSPPKLLPTVLSLPALEAIVRGEVDMPLTPQFDTEDDSDLDRWRTPRERVGPVALAERILWEVLERWDFHDHGRLGSAPRRCAFRGTRPSCGGRAAAEACSPRGLPAASFLSLQRPRSIATSNSWPTLRRSTRSPSHSNSEA